MRESSVSTGQRVYGLLIALLGIGFAFLTVVVAVDKVPLIVSGVTTTGTVISVDPNVRPHRRVGVVEFRDADGVARRTTTTSGVQHVGDVVKIIYLPSDPRHAGEYSFATIWAALLVLPLLSLFLVTAGRAIASPRKRRR